MSTQNQNNINPKSCNYGCNTQIYWNSSVNEYWEVFTKKKHICPNRSSTKSKSNNVTQSTTNTAPTNRPTYYNKKPWSNTQPKPKMSNSFELLTGPVPEIQKKYEILSDIVAEYKGKVHGSQRGQDPRTGQLIDLLVYYEVPEGKREEVKKKFNSIIRNNNQVVLQQR
jgi:hypothetical protein